MTLCIRWYAIALVSRSLILGLERHGPGSEREREMGDVETQGCPAVPRRERRAARDACALNVCCAAGTCSGQAGADATRLWAVGSVVYAGLPPLSRMVSIGLGLGLGLHLQVVCFAVDNVQLRSTRGEFTQPHARALLLGTRMCRLCTVRVQYVRCSQRGG